MRLWRMAINAPVPRFFFVLTEGPVVFVEHFVNPSHSWKYSCIREGILHLSVLGSTNPSLSMLQARNMSKNRYFPPAWEWYHWAVGDLQLVFSMKHCRLLTKVMRKSPRALATRSVLSSIGAERRFTIEQWKNMVILFFCLSRGLYYRDSNKSLYVSQITNQFLSQWKPTSFTVRCRFGRTQERSWWNRWGALTWLLDTTPSARAHSLAAKLNPATWNISVSGSKSRHEPFTEFLAARQSFCSRS